MAKQRRGETGQTPFRTGRFFVVNGAWYFATREGKEQGPFASRQLAEVALTNFVRDHGFAHTKAGEDAKVTHEQTDDQPSGGHRFYW